LSYSKAGNEEGIVERESIEPIPLFNRDGESAPRPKFQNPLIEEAIEAICTVVMAPDSIAMSSILSIASIGAQGHADVRTLVGSSPISLFFLTIAKSGERKSTCDSIAGKVMRDLQQERLQRYYSELAEFEAAEKVYVGDNDLIDEENNSRSTIPVPPINPTMLFGNLTIEAILQHFENGNPSVGIVSSEAGQFFGGHSMRRDSRLSTVAQYSLLWDDGCIDRHRATMPSRTYFGKRLSMHLMVQPSIALEVLSDQMLIDQGFLSRVLVSWPTSKIGERTIDNLAEYKNRVEESLGPLSKFENQLRRLLEVRSPVNQDNPLELTLPVLELSNGAQRRLTELYNRTELGQKNDQLFAHMQGFASKIAEQACRIAGVLTVFENIDGATISENCMANAIEVAEWFLEELRRLRENGYISPDLRDAEQLRKWLILKQRGELVTTRMIMRNAPKPSLNSERIQKLMKILKTHGWVTEMRQGTVVRGKRTRLSWLVIDHDKQ